MGTLAFDNGASSKIDDVGGVGGPKDNCVSPRPLGLDWVGDGVGPRGLGYIGFGAKA